jgi:hypothetical protein
MSKSQQVPERSAGAPRIDLNAANPAILVVALTLSKKLLDEREGRDAARSLKKLTELLEVKSPEEIIIHNRPDWRDR